MARCKSWRFLGGGADSADILPVGKNRKLWRLCRVKVPATALRCEQCETSLLMCPNILVRRALVNEPKQTPNVLHALLTDSNSGIALIAEQRIEQMEQEDTLFERLEMFAGKPTELKASVWS